MYLDSTSPLISKSVREILNQTLREIDAETIVRADTGYLIDKRHNKEQALMNDESSTAKRKVKIDRLNRGS